MDKIIIKNIDKSIGPGDIVGAFINEAEIKPNKIGNIDIRENFALVEINENITDKIIEIMNNNKIATQEVKVLKYSTKQMETLKKKEKYVNKFKDLVEMERKKEMERHKNEIKNLSGYQREHRGRAVLHLRARNQGTGFGNKYIIKYMRQKRGEKLPENEISVGDLVMISKNNPLSEDNPTGTVIERTNYSFSIVFDNKPQKFAYGKNLRMDLYVNDITYQRMLDSLTKIENNSDDRLNILIDKLLGIKDIERKSINNISFFNDKLNESQKKAVTKSMEAEDLFLIHGPPGTGKTVTCIEILQQAVSKDLSIIAAADSNTAVDNIVERLVKRGVGVVRIGHPARVTPMLRKHTLDFLLEKNNTFKKAKKLRKKALKLKEKQDDFTHPSGRWRRGMSNKKIKKLAKKKRGSRGVPYKKIKEMSKWLNIQKKVDDYFERVGKLENEAVNEIISNADVVCATNSTSGSELMENKQFDLLVLDEATQSTEPSALIPLVKSKKVIMAGDHKQLPPTILNEKAKHEGLSKSLFERLLEIYGKKIKEMLKVQYRMNKNIMNYSNIEFYDGEIIADELVKKWTLKELDLNYDKINDKYKKYLNYDEPIIYIDTKEKNSNELSKKDSKSYLNKIEGDLAVNLINKSLKLGLNPYEVALISPYKDQVDYIDKQIKHEDIEIDTVDGFQGREKELIILSLVRSNSNNNLGFLKDLRRLNVSLTRAKKKLIVIGDSNTLYSNPTYSRLIQYIKDKDGYYIMK